MNLKTNWIAKSMNAYEWTAAYTVKFYEFFEYKEGK